jgi:hypothetical protein
LHHAIASAGAPPAGVVTRDLASTERALLTDNVVLQGNTKLELARVLSAIGRREEATSQARAALGLFDAKGDLADAYTTRVLLDELAVPL